MANHASIADLTGLAVADCALDAGITIGGDGESSVAAGAESIQATGLAVGDQAERSTGIA